MENHARLADIYIKIYNKQPLVWEDLRFLAIYDKECFEKTCRNLIYNVPEAEKFMQTENEETQVHQVNIEKTDEQSEKLKNTIQNFSAVSDAGQENLPENIETFLENIKKMEWQKEIIQEVSVEKVKNLLGSLYMEMLFPHNDKDRYFHLEDMGEQSIFNKKA